jgi:TPR repeat protein
MKNLLLTLLYLFTSFSFADEDMGQYYLEQAKKIEMLHQESLSLYIKAAAKNNLEAQLKLMKFYETGDFNADEYIQKPNFRSACIWAYFASKNNYEYAAEKLQTFKEAYLQDPYEKSDKGGYEVKKETPSIDQLIKLANQGQINAQIDLGYRYLLGINVKEDRVSGLYWLYTAERANFKNVSLSQIYIDDLSSDINIFNDFSSEKHRDAAQKLSKKWIVEFNRKNPNNNIFQDKDSDVAKALKKEIEIEIEKANSTKTIKILDIAGAKIKCAELGFKTGTEKFGSCVLELTK